MEFNFFGNGNIGDDNRAWHRYAKVKPSSSIPGTYKSKIAIKDVLSQKTIGSYDVVLKKEPDQDRFGFVEFIDLFKSNERLLQTAVFNNEIWISSDPKSYIEYAIYPESFNISAFDLDKLSKKETPDVKVFFNGGFVISDLKGAGIETNEKIESFGDKPVEHFIFGENFRKSLSVTSYDEISASGAYNLKVENEVKELILAISDTNTSDNMLFITMDKDNSVVKVVKKIDKEYIEDNLNEVDIKVEGTVLKFTTDGGLTYKSYDLQGPQGLPGRMPKIAVVNGSWIKWENPDGSWSDPINLMGPSPQVFLNPDKTKVRFLANGVYTDWWNIEGKKGDIPLHRYVDVNGVEIADITAPGAGVNGVYLNFQEPTGLWSDKKINVIGAIPDHRYLDPEGNPTENPDFAYYIQFQTPSGGWGQIVKVIGMDGTDGEDGAPGVPGKNGEAPIVKTLKEDLTAASTAEETCYIQFENSDGVKVSEPIYVRGKNGSDGLPGKDGSNGLTPNLYFEKDVLVVELGGSKTKSPRLMPMPFWNGTTLKFLIGTDFDGNPVFSDSSDLVGPVPKHEINWATKEIRFLGPQGWGEWIAVSGPPGPRGAMGSTPRFKIEGGSLFFENPDGTWSDPITFAAKVDKKFENGVPYIRIYNSVTGLDSDWIPLTNISIPADVKPLLHVMKSEDMYPGAQMPNGYVPRDGRTIDLSYNKLLHAILVRNGLLTELETTFTLDEVPGSFVKITYDDILFDLVYPEGSVIIRSSEKKDPINDPILGTYDFKRTYLLDEGDELEDFYTYKRMMTIKETPQIVSEDIKSDTAQFIFSSPVTTARLYIDDQMVESKVGLNSIFNVEPNKQYKLEYLIKGDADITDSLMITKIFFTPKITNTEVINLSSSITETTENSISFAINTIYGTAAKVRRIDNEEVLDAPCTFNGLEHNADYAFVAWYPETNISYMSPNSAEIIVKTDKKLRTITPLNGANGTSSISFLDSDSMNLTLANTTEDDSMAYFVVSKNNAVIKEGYSPLSIESLFAGEAYEVKALYKESQNYQESHNPDIYNIVVPAKVEGHVEPGNIVATLIEGFIEVEADVYTTSNGIEYNPKVVVAETGQAFYANTGRLALTGITPGEVREITLNVFFEENPEIKMSAIAERKVMTVAKFVRQGATVENPIVTQTEINFGVSNSADDGIAPIIKYNGEIATLPMTELTPNTEYTFDISYPATLYYKELTQTLKLTTAGLERTIEPVVASEAKTAYSISLGVSNSTEGETPAEIKLVETGEILKSSEVFSGLTPNTTYNFEIWYPESGLYEASNIVTHTVTTDAKVERTVNPVVTNETRTDTSVTFNVANSSEDGAVAKIKLVETGEIIDSAETNTFSGLTPETQYHFEIWYPEVGTHLISSVTSHVVSTLPIPVARLVVPAVSDDSKTSTTITMTVANSIEDNATAKIRLVETGLVVDSIGINVFEGLTPGTTYNFEIWYPKSDTHLASSVFEYAGTTDIA